MDRREESKYLVQLIRIAMMKEVKVENVPHENTLASRRDIARNTSVDNTRRSCTAVEPVRLLEDENDSSSDVLQFEDNERCNSSSSYSQLVSCEPVPFSPPSLRDLNRRKCHD